MKKFLYQHNAVIALGLSCLLLVNGGMHSLETQLSAPQSTVPKLLQMAHGQQVGKPSLASCEQISAACSVQLMTHHSALTVLQAMVVSQQAATQPASIHL